MERSGSKGHKKVGKGQLGEKKYFGEIFEDFQYRSLLTIFDCVSDLGRLRNDFSPNLK